jgi:hypothetical protein
MRQGGEWKLYLSFCITKEEECHEKLVEENIIYMYM